MKHKKLARRQDQRKQTLYLVQHDLITRTVPTTEQIEELFSALNTNNLARLGILKLSKLDLNSCYVIPDILLTDIMIIVPQNIRMTLISFASCLKNRDSSVFSLLRSGADPTVRASLNDAMTPDKSHLTASLRRYLLQAPSCFAVYIILKVNQFRITGDNYASCLGDEDGNTCELCKRVNDQPLLWSECKHYICESCFWSEIEQYSDDDDLSCPLCRECREYQCNELISSPKINKEASLAIFRHLPVTLSLAAEMTEKATKPKFKGRSLSELASLYVGITQSQRSGELWKAVQAGKCVRIAALLEAGVDLDDRNEYGHTALFVAVLAGQTQAVRLLLAFGADPAVVDDAGSSLLTAVCASSSGASNRSGNRSDKEMIRVLLDAGCRTDQVGALGKTADEYCAMKGYTSTQDMLLMHEDADNNLVGGLSRLSLSSDELYYASMVTLDSLVLQCLIPLDTAHPGAGSFYIDGAFSESFLSLLEFLFGRLPVAPAEKLSCSDRSYYNDSELFVTRVMRRVLNHAAESCPDIVKCSGPFPQMRFLHYKYAGGKLPPHVDLSRTDSQGVQSTHTFILYIYDCDGGETALLQSVVAADVDKNASSSPMTLATVRPKRGRLLLFPHLCPHEGRPVITPPKLLIRGEVY